MTASTVVSFLLHAASFPAPSPTHKPVLRSLVAYDH